MQVLEGGEGFQEEGIVKLISSGRRETSYATGSIGRKEQGRLEKEEISKEWEQNVQRS